MIQPKDGGWEIILWMGEAFDFSTPFRTALEQIAKTLPGQVTMELPRQSEGEDFIEGSPKFGSRSVAIYFEHSLGYLSLS